MTDGTDEESLEWTTTASETEYSCPGFEVRRDDVELPGGTAASFHSVVDSPTVVILPFASDGQVVVIEEWRQAVGRVNLGLPAGGIEPGEAPREAVERELREETGYEAGALDRLAVYEPANGLLDTTYHYYVAHGCTPAGSQELDHNESIRVLTRSFTELEDRALAGALQDGRSALAILQYALQASE